MAEPQANPNMDPGNARNRESASQSAQRTAQAEARSFDEAAGAGARAVQGASQVARSAIDDGRQMAETGRRAGQSMTEAWRRSMDPFLVLQLDMNRWFDDLWRQALGFRAPAALPSLRPFAALGPGSFFGLPPADFKETKNAHLLALELPGLKPEDIEISIEEDMLMISGHKVEDSEDATAAYCVNERRYGRFERAFPLASDVDRQKIQAQFKDGLLKITLPKRPEAAVQRSKIEVKS